jgi:hypothetical protein
LEHQKVLTDLMDTQNKSSSLKRSRDDVVAKLSLIQASLFALEQVYFICSSVVNAIAILSKHVTK